MKVRLQVADIQCPECSSPELHPDGDKLLIRAFKLMRGGRWQSQCLVCAGYYDEELRFKGEDAGSPAAGWFSE